jgi:hypothetical protein
VYFFAIPYLLHSKHCSEETGTKTGQDQHWQLDVSFREDAARNRKDNGPTNIAVLRRRALDLARRDTSKGSLSIKLRRSGWSDAFLLSLLNQLAST